jgi:hypothetical protein
MHVVITGGGLRSLVPQNVLARCGSLAHKNKFMP